VQFVLQRDMRPAVPRHGNISNFRTFSWEWRGVPRETSGVTTMLGWALTFLIVALIAAILGFGGIAGFAVEIAKIIFFVAIVLFVISAVVGLMRGRNPTVP
jgi:uncharacterized membrane protein YtjA (UPF0391 family)